MILKYWTAMSQMNFINHQPHVTKTVTDASNLRNASPAITSPENTAIWLEKNSTPQFFCCPSENYHILYHENLTHLGYNDLLCQQFYKNILILIRLNLIKILIQRRD